MAHLRCALLLLIALLLPSCGGSGPNPFATASSVVALRPTAAIVFVSDAYASKPGGLREVFAIDEDGSNMIRLTTCNTATRQCDSSEVAPASDRRRLAIRRITADTDKNGRLGPGDAEAVVIADTERGVEGALSLQAPSSAGVALLATDHLSGLDWSPVADILVYSANGDGGSDDLFRSIPRPDTDNSQTRNLTFSASVRERRPRVDPSGNVAAFERSDATTKSQIWIFQTTVSILQVTSGGPGSDVLAGTQMLVGGDTDPDYSPDGLSLVFRRLSGIGNGGLGTWDLLTVRTDGTALTTIVSGPFYRSAPDWGAKGIVFSEIDRTTGLAQLVVVQPDGSGRRVLATLNGFDIASTRWLAPR